MKMLVFSYMYTWHHFRIGSKVWVTTIGKSAMGCGLLSRQGTAVIGIFLALFVPNPKPYTLYTIPLEIQRRGVLRRTYSSLSTGCFAKSPETP